MQGTGDGSRFFTGRPLEIQVIHGVVRNHVHNGVFAGEEAGDAVDFLRRVIHPFQQCPLILDRVAGGAGVGLAQRYQLLRVEPGGLGQQTGPQVGPGGVQGQGQGWLDGFPGQAVEDPGIADGGKN